MGPELQAALGGLALITIGALGTLVKVLIKKILNEIQTNTRITTEARDASNGQLSSLTQQLAAERNTVSGLRMVVRERDDRIAYIVARVPQAEDLMRDYSDRRTARASEADVVAAENHLLGGK